MEDEKQTGDPSKDGKDVDVKKFIFLFLSFIKNWNILLI